MNAGTPISIEEALNVAISHHQSGRLNDAQSIYRQILGAAPAHFDALRLSGLVELQTGNPAAATVSLSRAIAENASFAPTHHHLAEAYRALDNLAAAERSLLAALALDPNFAEAHNSLAIVYQTQGRGGEAVASFRRAASANPAWGDPHFNLGLALKSQGKSSEAVHAFFEGWSRDPRSFESAGQCVQTLAAQVRAGKAVAGPSKTAQIAPPPSFTVAFCSIDDVKCRSTVALYEGLFAGWDHEIIAIRDARSLAEAYNRAASQARGDIVILSHDDIGILCADFATRLADCFEKMDVVGIMGASEIAGPRWSSAGHPHLSGWITHHERSGKPYLVDLVSALPRRTGMRALDGVLLAARRAVLSAVSFDEATFDGFHLYDIDWTYRVSEAGFTLGTAGDLLVVHQSRGRFGQDWQRYADRFCAKYGITYAPPREPVKIWEAELNTPVQVRAFFAQLMALSSAATPPSHWTAS